MANEADTPVRLSESAARRIGEITAAEKRPFLRVAVNGGGCSGFSYAFDFADAADEDDLVISRGAAKVVIDEASLPFLEGSEIDFVEELIGASFKIRNPNAKSSCGCGTSFSV
ncbi:MAG: iron-sulfur cluster insertion protein ErpA [Caulobacterales bacterium]|nr:iron-sulfur cluster insertion protein ErpA [Caulobacterales bacterium]